MNRVLIVSSTDRGPLAKALQSSGFEVFTATDCKSARRSLESPVPAEIVFSDLDLPDGNWCTIVREIRDRELNTRLLVCTQQADRLLIIEVVQRGGEYALARSHAAETVAELLEAA